MDGKALVQPEGSQQWTGPADASLELRIAYDTNHLFLAGVVHDDVLVASRPNPAAGPGDAIELFLGFGPDEPTGPAAFRADDLRLLLLPLSEVRPWSLLDPRLGLPGQGGSALTGLFVAGRVLPKVGYQFEAAIPFHQMPNLRPGCSSIGFALVLHDRDGQDDDVSLVSSGKDPAGPGGLGRLHFRGDGPFVGEPPPARLLTSDLIADLPFLLVPLSAVAVLLLLMRSWTAMKTRVRWLRPALLAGGLLLFLGGLLLPSLWLDLRDRAQRRELADAVATARNLVDKVEQGTLASYRGAARDRALMDLLAGRTVARQKYTSYRFLSQIAESEFGAPVREFPDESFRVRPYWVPLEPGRVETFHFDPPLRGEELYLVVGRPYVAPLPFPLREQRARLRLELSFGAGAPRTDAIDFDHEFPASGRSLGRELYEVDYRRVVLSGELRTLGVTVEEGADLRLVGLSLLPRRGEPVVPLFLGTASLDGVSTDLRGPYPEDAGIELGPGATAKVSLPAGMEPSQKLWLFYRATYPGVPTANPGATVAEVVLHFRGGAPPRKLTLEHQVSMFYELVVHNTRDQPPEGSPAAVALAWIDESKERHINMVLPVPDLPAGADLEAIEFRNLADYRMRFRSVVFGSEKAAAPQDPDDSPLVRDGQDRRLRDDVRRALAAAAVTIYRGGRLSESTLSAEQQKEQLTLPRQAVDHADASRPLLTPLPTGGRRATVYVPLTGDGWDGAVLAVAVGDSEWAQAAESGSRIGLVLGLGSTPLLLVLLSELLAAVTNLRFRLMAVLSVASLAPLALLSFVLAQVLERGHETDQQEGMRRQVQSAVGQLADQMQLLRGSARQWLADLATLLDEKLGKTPDDAAPARMPQTLPALQQLMAGQLPPEWRGGFLKLEWNPTVADRPGEPLATVAGDARLAATEAPARLEPGVYVQWGTVVIAVRSERPVRGGTLALTVARPLGADLLGSLAPGQSVLLCDPRGYPLAVAGTRLDPQALVQHGREPAVMAQRERAMFAALDQGAPVVARSASAYGDWLWGCEVLRDLQQTPRALLLLLQPDQRATLDLAIGRIPVRAFFFFVAGLLVVLSSFLSFVVSGRISRPIEVLERSAQAISRGELETRVQVEEGGQIGRLSRAFNQMASGLQGRLLDLQKLNRAMRDLSAQLDANHSLQVLRRFCEQQVPVDRVVVALLDPESGQVDFHGPAETLRVELPPELQFLPRAAGAFCLCWPGGRGAAAGLLAHLPGIHAVVGLPLLAGGRCRGAVLLLFENARPEVVELDLLATVVAQAAVALENAQLYRHAVQDPTTGAFVPDYFRRRAAEEVALAHQRSSPVVLIGLGLGDGVGRPRGLRRFAAVLREHAPRGSFLCHAGAGQFQLLIGGMDRAAAEALVGRVLESWQNVVDRAPESDVEDRRPTVALAMFPEEAASAEFLFEVLRERLASGSPMAPAAFEEESSLHRAGITAVSPPMREVYRMLRRVAPTDLAILFLGETGTGKEVLTNLVHRWSRRSSGPLVKVHCAALSETLLASELFGHERGAFTGADRRKIGKFEQANGGTIFLDEVGEIPLDVQVKLLRVLQEREVDRVGGIDPVPVDVRVVAATNRDIEKMVADGRFREDLYYRLQGIVVHVPPLRERRQEIPALVEQFRSEVVASGECRVRGWTTDAMDELFRRDWPGNIRELRNAVYRAMVLATTDVVERRDILAALPQPAAPPPASPVPLPRPEPAHDGRPVEEPPAPVGLETAADRLGEKPAGAPASKPADPTPDPAAPPPVAAEPLVPLPRSAPEPQQVLASLPIRVQDLYRHMLEAGAIGTQEHMTRAGVSHRTGLRDLQILVDLGLAVRMGSRRGARYRPKI